jgi:drug/metabolite transporter (DMT)-like permease
MFEGIILATLAMALWGSVFICPLILSEFTIFDIIFGRYFIYGIFSLLFLTFKYPGFWKKYPVHVWTKALIYAIGPLVLYYFLLIWGIRLAGVTISSLIIGLLPITITLYGNWVCKEYSYSVLIVPLVLILIGVITINANEIVLGDTPIQQQLIGVACVITCLGIWTWYSVDNAKFLKTTQAIDSQEWTFLIGLCGMGVTGLICSFVGIVVPGKMYLLSSQISQLEIITFIGVALFLGIISSWLAFSLWNRASSLLPVSLVGQLIVLETVFALIYNYLYISKWPNMTEIFGILCALLGVFVGYQAMCSSKKVLTDR